MSTDEAAIRQLIADWAGAVRGKDIAGILRHHASDIVMFDVPPPLQFAGLKEYEEAWHLFYEMTPDAAAFDIRELNVVAGDEVAFTYGRMQAVLRSRDGRVLNLQTRLTLGLRKQAGQWTILHEHHSLPVMP